MGAWIEISPRFLIYFSMQSLPVWERELKSRNKMTLIDAMLSLHYGSVNWNVPYNYFSFVLKKSLPTGERELK